MFADAMATTSSSTVSVKIFCPPALFTCSTSSSSVTRFISLPRRSDSSAAELAAEAPLPPPLSQSKSTEASASFCLKSASRFEGGVSASAGSSRTAPARSSRTIEERRRSRRAWCAAGSATSARGVGSTPCVEAYCEEETPCVTPSPPPTAAPAAPAGAGDFAPDFNNPLSMPRPRWKGRSRRGRKATRAGGAAEPRRGGGAGGRAGGAARKRDGRWSRSQRKRAGGRGPGKREWGRRR